MALPTPERLEAAYRWACELDVKAPKPGNVSDAFPGHGMQAAQFRASSDATAGIIADVHLPLGRSIRLCAERTRAAAGCNTNLGIILLCAPLARAAVSCDTADEAGEVADTLVRRAGIDDTQEVFDAISILSPAGLGESDTHDARQPATAGLFDVMQAGSYRDTIAWQYANGFAGVIDLAKRTYLQALTESDTADFNGLMAVVALYLEILATWPDSHIARKYGAYMAEVVREEAVVIREQFSRLSHPADILSMLQTFDTRLKADSLNPGTSADLTVAVLFLFRLYGGVADSTTRLRSVPGNGGADSR